MKPGEGRNSITLKGWVEQDGEVLARKAIEAELSENPHAPSRFGGEFLLCWRGCVARDLYGIVPGPVPPGTITCNGIAIDRVNPACGSGELPVPRLIRGLPGRGPLSVHQNKESPNRLQEGHTGRETGYESFHPSAGRYADLDRAIQTAVSLRSTCLDSERAAVAFSGGPDSALIAALSGLPCITAGVRGSHDLQWANETASLMGIETCSVTVSEDEIEGILPDVTRTIPKPTPLNVEIAATLWFVTREAAAQGFTRLLLGQGADELFGGYARYRACPDPGAAMAADLANIGSQLERDQAVASRFGLLFSLPYLDCRVVRAAAAIPAGEKVKKEIGKIPLREVASDRTCPEIAWHPKKAMQYGSGISRVIRKCARQNGYKTSVQRYLDYLGASGNGIKKGD